MKIYLTSRQKQSLIEGVAFLSVGIIGGAVLHGWRGAVAGACLAFLWRG